MWEIAIYDALNNRLSHNDNQYQNNALHAVLHDGKREFSYDKRGNRKSQGEVQYTYDGFDRLVAVDTSKEHVTYTYDAFNRRLEKHSATVHERYLYTGQNEIGVICNNQLTELRILGEGLGAEIGAAVAIELGSELFIPLHDHRGNVTCLLDANGAVVEKYSYDAFGVEQGISTRSPWRFSSKRVDPETGFVYFGRRYYDPSIGKWLTQDPLGLQAGPNLYAYVLNNPMTHFDKYGLYLLRTGGPREWKLPTKDKEMQSKFEELVRSDYQAQGYDMRCSRPNDGETPRLIAIGVGQKELPGMTFTFTNGVNTSLERALEVTHYVSELTGGYKVWLLYDPKSMPVIGELGMAYAEREMPLNAEVAENIKEFCEQIWGEKGEEHVIHLDSHSRGAIQCRNAISGLSNEQRKKIVSIAVCGAAVILPGSCLDTKNILNDSPFRDPVPYTDRIGLERSKELNPSGDHLLYCPSDPSIKDILDHDCDSPTYKKSFRDQLAENIRKYGGL